MTHSLPPPEPVDIAAALRAIQHEVRELRDRQSLRKNGHTVGQYIGKWLTPQNICIAGLALFTVGTRVQEVQTGVMAAVTASEAAIAASDATEKLAQQLGARARIVDEQLTSIQQRQETYATAADVAAVKDLQRLAVTRREWRESIDAQQQILARLARIERKVDGQ